MSNYDPQSWQVPMREVAWNQGPPSGMGSIPPMHQQQPPSLEQHGVFGTQIEEVDRALDNLAKSGKLYSMPSRRDSVPMMGGQPSFADFGHRAPQRHSVDYDQMRPQSSSNLQNYYASQRHQPRPNEAEQMMQAKRRMAAQRERELRNYHQEQQYNRNVSVQGGKSDRAISPNTMNEEDRRELIARQHRALYGTDAPYYDEESHTPRPSNPTSGHTSSAGGRGPSPRGYEAFAMGQMQAQSNSEEVGQLNPNEQGQHMGKGPSPKPQQGNSNENSTASPASNPPSQTFSLFESTAQQSSRTSTSSPGGSPPRQGKTSAPGVAPIGTRPAQASNPAFNNKRAGTPSQSPLSQGYNANNENLNVRASGNERSTSSASNPSHGAKESSSGVWGTGSGVWGSSSNNKSIGAVWG